MFKKLILRSTLACAILNLMAGVNLAMAQSATNHPVHATPPTRDPKTPGYVAARELPAARRPRKFYHRSDAQPRAGNGGADKRAARSGL